MEDSGIISLDIESQHVDLIPHYIVFTYSTNHITGPTFKNGFKFIDGSIEYTVIEDHCLTGRPNGGINIHHHQMKARMHYHDNIHY